VCCRGSKRIDLAGRKIGEAENWIEARMGSSEWGRKGGKRKSPALETKDTEKNLLSGDVNGYGHRERIVLV